MRRFSSAVRCTRLAGLPIVLLGIGSLTSSSSARLSGMSTRQKPDAYLPALYSRPGRARIEITTKGGTPQFHGSGNFLYRDSVFDASNAFATTKPSEQRTYYEGSLTGPLSHSKKTTFLLALDKDSDNQQAIVVAADPNGEINANVPNPTNHYFISGRVFHDYKQGNQFLDWIFLRTQDG